MQHVIVRWNHLRPFFSLLLLLLVQLKMFVCACPFVLVFFTLSRCFYWHIFLYSSSVNISVDYSIEPIQDNKYSFICREDYKILFMISHIVNDYIFIACNPFDSNNSWKDFYISFYKGKKSFFQVECFCHLFSNRKARLIGLTLRIIWRC